MQTKMKELIKLDEKIISWIKTIDDLVYLKEILNIKTALLKNTEGKAKKQTKREIEAILNRIKELRLKQSGRVKNNSY